MATSKMKTSSYTLDEVCAVNPSVGPDDERPDWPGQYYETVNLPVTLDLIHGQRLVILSHLRHIIQSTYKPAYWSNINVIKVPWENLSDSEKIRYKGSHYEGFVYLIWDGQHRRGAFIEWFKTPTMPCDVIPADSVSVGNEIFKVKQKEGTRKLSNDDIFVNGFYGGDVEFKSMCPVLQQIGVCVAQSIGRGKNKKVKDDQVIPKSDRATPSIRYPALDDARREINNLATAIDCANVDVSTWTHEIKTDDEVIYDSLRVATDLIKVAFEYDNNARSGFKSWSEEPYPRLNNGLWAGIAMFLTFNPQFKTGPYYEALGHLLRKRGSSHKQPTHYTASIKQLGGERANYDSRSFAIGIYRLIETDRKGVTASTCPINDEMFDSLRDFASIISVMTTKQQAGEPAQEGI